MLPDPLDLHTQWHLPCRAVEGPTRRHAGGALPDPTHSKSGTSPVATPSTKSVSQGTTPATRVVGLRPMARDLGFSGS